MGDADFVYVKCYASTKMPCGANVGSKLEAYFEKPSYIEPGYIWKRYASASLLELRLNSRRKRGRPCNETKRTKLSFGQQ